jgi:hypothetical protein
VYCPKQKSISGYKVGLGLSVILHIVLLGLSSLYDIPKPAVAKSTEILREPVWLESIILEIPPSTKPILQKDVPPKPEIKPVDTLQIELSIQLQDTPEQLAKTIIDTRASLASKKAVQPKLEIESDPEFVFKPELEIVPELEPETDTKSNLDLDDEPKSEPKFNPEPEVAPVDQSELEPEPEPKFEPPLALDPDPDPEWTLKSDLEPDLKPELESLSEVEIEPESKSDPITELEREFASEPESEPDLNPESELEFKPIPDTTQPTLDPAHTIVDVLAQDFMEEVDHVEEQIPIEEQALTNPELPMVKYPDNTADTQVKNNNLQLSDQVDADIKVNTPLPNHSSTNNRPSFRPFSVNPGGASSPRIAGRRSGARLRQNRSSSMRSNAPYRDGPWQFEREKQELRSENRAWNQAGTEQQIDTGYQRIVREDGTVVCYREQDLGKIPKQEHCD